METDHGKEVARLNQEKSDLVAEGEAQAVTWEASVEQMLREARDMEQLFAGKSCFCFWPAADC